MAVGVEHGSCGDLIVGQLANVRAAFDAASFEMLEDGRAMEPILPGELGNRLTGNIVLKHPNDLVFCEPDGVYAIEPGSPCWRLILRACARWLLACRT